MSITVSFKPEDWDDEDRVIGPVVVIDHGLYDERRARARRLLYQGRYAEAARIDPGRMGL